jgi:hypothetical protein
MDAEDAARSLQASFSQFPEPRSDRGRRHPLAAILTLIVLASLDGASSPASIADWGRRQSPRLVAAMGFQRSQSPSDTTLRNVLGRIDGDAFRGALGAWTRQVGPPGGFDLLFDPSTPVGFRVLKRASAASAGSNVVALASPPVKRVPQLRRWRRRD